MYDQDATNRALKQNIRAMNYVLYPGAYQTSAPCQVVVGYNNCPYQGNSVMIEDALRRGKFNSP